jgi:hypothetical protein
MLDYYDYSDPEVRLADAVSYNLLLDQSKNSMTCTYDLIKFVNNVTFLRDFSKAFDEHEMLADLNKRKLEKITNSEIENFFEEGKGN